MNKTDKEKLKYELDYVDIVFGAIIAIGFTNFEKITNIYGYVMFFFVYFMSTEYYFDWRRVINHFEFKKGYLRAVDIPVLLAGFQIVTNSYKGDVAQMYLLIGFFFLTDAMWSFVKLLEYREDDDGKKLFSYFVVHDVMLIILFFSIPSFVTNDQILLVLLVLVYIFSSLLDYIYPKKTQIKL